MDISDKPGPVWLDRLADRPHHKVGAGHIVQAIEGRDEIVASVRRNRILAGIMKHEVLDCRMLCILPCTSERYFRNVIAMELRVGIGLGHFNQRYARAAS